MIVFPSALKNNAIPDPSKPLINSHTAVNGKPNVSTTRNVLQESRKRKTPHNQENVTANKVAALTNSTEYTNHNTEHSDKFVHYLGRLEDNLDFGYFQDVLTTFEADQPANGMITQSGNMESKNLGDHASELFGNGTMSHSVDTIDCDDNYIPDSQEDPFPPQVVEKKTGRRHPTPTLKPPEGLPVQRKWTREEELELLELYAEAVKLGILRRTRYVSLNLGIDYYYCTKKVNWLRLRHKGVRVERDAKFLEAIHKCFNTKPKSDDNNVEGKKKLNLSVKYGKQILAHRSQRCNEVKCCKQILAWLSQRFNQCCKQNLAHQYKDLLVKYNKQI